MQVEVKPAAVYIVRSLGREVTCDLPSESGHGQSSSKTRLVKLSKRDSRKTNRGERKTHKTFAVLEELSFIYVIRSQRRN